MLAQEHGCLKITQLLSAVENAATKRTLVHGHIDHCFDIGLFQKDRQQARVVMDEFKSIVKYL